MQFQYNFYDVENALRRKAKAVAFIKGNEEYEYIKGRVLFYALGNSTLIKTGVVGLPKSDMPCENRIFGFHIHSGSSCSGTENDPFLDTGSHYNPENCPHPQHSGDMPPLFSANGRAFSLFLTDRFNINEIIGKTAVIHSMPDDFTTQPSGNAGEKIACGTIRKVL